MNVAIIGCGLIGQKRSKTLGQHKLILCVDHLTERAHAIAQQHPGCETHTDWQMAVNHSAVDVIIIATLHATLAMMTQAAVSAGKHVLVEKPAARSAAELDSVIAAAQKNQVLVRVGFNHRYHRAFRKARELVDDNALGELMFVRGRYGHGGRIGYDKEWRSRPELSGGGELIDQGVHLIDLARWFLGDFDDVQGFAHTYYWNMPVDDNGFLLLKTPENKVALLHASCTEWKNLFSFEIYGRLGKIEVNGLGGSYGVERLVYYKMLPEMGPPETYAWEYPMEDDSWRFEMQEFFNDITHLRQPSVGLYDAREALKIVENIYRISRNDHCT